MEMLALLLLAVMAWYWLDSLRSREIAVNLGKQYCEVRGVQFLDDTVAIARTRLRRNDAGRLMLFRVYSFEFSDTGDNRLAGRIDMLGHQVERIEMEAYPGSGQWQPIEWRERE